MFRRKTFGTIALLLVLVVALAGCGVAQSRPGDANNDNETPPVADKPAITTVEVYFVSGGEQFQAVTRDVADDNALQGAIEELLKGPSKSEKEQGLTSWFSSETAGMLKSVTIDENGTAVIDFKNFSSIIPNASTSAGSQELMGQLNKTIFQFDQVNAVDYRFDGSADQFWNWLQFDAHLVDRGQ